MNSELRFHIEELTEEYVAAGMSPEEAHRRAMLDFGGHENLKEQVRDVYRIRLLDATLANQITSLDEARAVITQLRDDFQQSLATLQTENKLLRQKLELFLKRYFGGTKNESLDPKQLELLLAGLAAMSAPARIGCATKFAPGIARNCHTDTAIKATSANRGAR